MGGNEWGIATFCRFCTCKGKALMLMSMGHQVKSVDHQVTPGFSLLEQYVRVAVH